MARRKPLVDVVEARWPGWEPGTAELQISQGHILVEGRVLTNPRAQVDPAAPLRFEPPAELAGRRKLGWALDHFGVAATRAVALDVGACTGGFTSAWLEAGAAKVYAVDAGHGQLLGSLRQDPRVVNLERTNLSALHLDGGELDRISIDVSYLSLVSAVSQLAGLGLRSSVELVGLVKPMFELRLATIPTDPGTLATACDRAVEGIAAAGWTVLGAEECPVRGGKGAVEFFVHARL